MVFKLLLLLFHFVHATSLFPPQNPAATELPNNNAGIEANLLLSGRFALVYNPTTSDRNPLRIALSSDEGDEWGVREVESFSFFPDEGLPYLLLRSALGPD